MQIGVQNPKSVTSPCTSSIRATSAGSPLAIVPHSGTQWRMLENGTPQAAGLRRLPGYSKPKEETF